MEESKSAIKKGSFLDLSVKKSVLEALGLFVFGYFVLFLFTGLASGTVELVLTGEIRDPRIFGWTTAVLVGKALSIVVCVTLVLWIAKLKRAMTPLNIVLALAAGFLALFTEYKLGLLIPAFLTTRQPRGDLD